MIESPTIELKQIISPEFAWKYHVIPKKRLQNSIEFYIDESKDLENTSTILRALLHSEIELEQVEAGAFKEILAREYRIAKDSSLEQVNVQSDSFLESMILEASSLEASDIHVEAQEDLARVRMRIDGVLIEKYSLSKAQYPALINKIKIKSNLNISEKRLPQDGRLLVRKDKTSLDIRVSILPTLYGEKAVLRLLSKDSTDINLDLLGMSEKQLTDFKTGIQNPNGIILISGPTGSGKTTTLYATLKVLNDATRNIVTIEDPIEYTLEGINQVQLKESIGLDFNKAIRTFLRQDPDIIMLGEIRDSETASMAVRAALTGHLVLSTIHTNSAWGIITRLIDMEVPAFLLSNTINTVIAQRLVRKLCENCKIKTNDTIDWPVNFEPPNILDEHFVEIGCLECHHTGFKGRLALYEIIPVTKQIQKFIRDNEIDISEYLEKMEISNLSDNAFKLLEKGKTSYSEILPIVLSHSK